MGHFTNHFHGTFERNTLPPGPHSARVGGAGAPDPEGADLIYLENIETKSTNPRPLRPQWVVHI
jgi:hypothetical protein